MFSAEGGWTLDSFVDEVAGLVKLSIYRSSPSVSSAGQIANLSFLVSQLAPLGETPTRPERLREHSAF